jgi:hypothetical protein
VETMSKIVQAINSMIQNNEYLHDVTLSDGEFFFKYKGYIWSIKNTDDGYYLYYYPGFTEVNHVICANNNGVINSDSYALYRSADIKTREAYESFSELHQIVRNKLFNMDNVLDDIIGDM